MSFYECETRELKVEQTNVTGYFVDKAHPHKPGPWAGFGGLHSIEDHIGVRQPGYKHLLADPIPPAGTYDWNIPQQYRVIGINQREVYVFDLQRYYKDEGTAMSVSKLTAVCTRTPPPPTP